jgi:hypothetical protein
MKEGVRKGEREKAGETGRKETTLSNPKNQLGCSSTPGNVNQSPVYED